MFYSTQCAISITLAWTARTEKKDRLPSKTLPLHLTIQKFAQSSVNTEAYFKSVCSVSSLLSYSKWHHPSVRSTFSFLSYILAFPLISYHLSFIECSFLVNINWTCLSWLKASKGPNPLKFLYLIGKLGCSTLERMRRTNSFKRRLFYSSPLFLRKLIWIKWSFLTQKVKSIL